MIAIDHSFGAGVPLPGRESPPFHPPLHAAVPPVAPGFQFAGWSRPLGRTGGDFHDWQALPDGRMLFAVGDVAGHGNESGALAEICRNHLRSCWQVDDHLGRVMARVNQRMTAELEDGRFVTAAVGLLDRVTGEMQLYSAGHGPVLYYRARDRRFVHLSANHVPLGLFDLCPRAGGPPHRLSLEPGDSLVVLTDGFDEWMNDAGHSFGLEGVRKALGCCAGAPPRAMIEDLLSAVHDFAGGVAQRDDLTALIVKRDLFECALATPWSPVCHRYAA